MRFGDLNWMDVESYLQQDDRVILVFGATEQHGYLSLQTDARIPLALADAASKETGVLIAPELNFGVSPYFLTYPGTISLKSETFLRVVEDMVESLYGYGFRRILVVNGHGGNDLAGPKMVELANRLSGLKVSWYSWWESQAVNDLAAKHHLLPEHASWMEAFYFTRVAELPEGDKSPVEVNHLLNASETRATYGDGMFGGKYLAEDQVMDQLFDICLKEIVNILKNI